MEIVKVKFTRSQNIAGMSTYREGEVAGFSRQLAEKIVGAGAGQILDDTRPTRRSKKDVTADEGSTYSTK
jgi:hypothetical protein